MTHYFGDNQTFVQNTWFFQNLQLNKLDVLSNGDLIAQINIVKGDYFIDSSDTSIYFNNFIARINKDTGKLIWAYAYFFNGFLDQHIANSFKVINDTIWAYGYFGVTASSYSDRYGIALKINANGDLEDSYTIEIGQFINSLRCKSAVFFDDGSYIASWLSMSYSNSYGVSPYSML